MKHILVPCDFSQPSREAFRMAVDLARKSTGEIIVLHAIYIPLMYDPTFAGGLPLAYDPDFRSNVEDDIKAGFEKLKSVVPTDNIPVSLEIIFGDLVSSVKQVVNEKNIDLIVMGTTGASGLQEIIVGSNTEKVVRHATVPVLAVHRACALKSIKKILLPTDLKFDETVFIEKVKELQQFFGATLHLLWINTSELGEAEATEALEEFVKHYKLSNVAVHARSNLNEARGIMDYAYDAQADLVVMATHARKGLEHLFSGSVTEKVVNHLQLPVWTFALKH